LFVENDEAVGEYIINENSMEIVNNSYAEISLKDSKAGDSFQFIRHGYFVADSKYSSKEQLVFNRIVSLKSSYKKD